MLLFPPPPPPVASLCMPPLCGDSADAAAAAADAGEVAPFAEFLSAEPPRSRRDFFTRSQSKKCRATLFWNEAACKATDKRLACIGDTYIQYLWRFGRLQKCSRSIRAGRESDEQRARGMCSSALNASVAAVKAQSLYPLDYRLSAPSLLRLSACTPLLQASAE